MKTKTLLPIFLSLAAMTLAGCGQNGSENNTPATTNSAVEQTVPGAVPDNNVIAPPVTNTPDTNNPTTNTPATGNTTTNQ